MLPVIPVCLQACAIMHGPSLPLSQDTKDRSNCATLADMYCKYKTWSGLLVAGEQACFHTVHTSFSLQLGGLDDPKGGTVGSSAVHAISVWYLI